jgi:hypothetical protein
VSRCAGRKDEQHVSDFMYHYRLESLATSIPSSYGDEKEVTDKYVHVVGFNDPKDHESITREYLQTYLRVDPDSDDSKQRRVSTMPHLCADAILTYYLRSAIHRKIEIEGRSEPIYDADVPTGEPIFKTDTSAIWLASKDE